MALVFFFTGAFGFMECLAFVKTRGIVLPIGLHLGWNLVISMVFSGGGFFGKGVLVPNNNSNAIIVQNAPYVALNIVLPLILVTGVSVWLLRSRSGNEQNTTY